MAETEKAQTDEDLLAEAKANYKHALEWWGHNQKAWLEAAKFRQLEQWPSNIKKKREAEGKPCLVVDKVNQYIKQVVNDSRQNRPSIKVRPVDDHADIDAAEGFQGLIRSILNRSRADDALDTAIDHAAGNGFGYIRVITEYAHEQTFDQEIRVKRVRNPLTILLGPHEEADGSDAQYGFAVVDESKKTYKRKYPNAKVTDWHSDGFSEGWSDETSVKVCEYFYKVEEPGQLHLLADGTSVQDDEYRRAVQELGPDAVPPILETRTIPLVRVKWCRLSGAEILEKNDWLGKHLPIVPVYGDESDIEGKVTYTGMVRLARDPQILHNFARSMFAQRVAMTPISPWLAGAEQIADFPEWHSPNVANVLRYKMYDEAGNQLPAPQRISPSDVPAGFAQDMQISEHDIQAALGMYAASLGQPSNEKSGKAILARQREGDTATFHYQDNLNRAIRQLGRILVDLGPKIYDSTRTVRILGEDGSTSEAQIDPRQEVAHQKTKQNGKELSIYNLGVGIYDVDIDSGPSYTTKRAESAEAMIQLTQANPSMWQTHGDLIVAAQDWPNAQEFAKRSKMLLPPQIQAEDDGGNPEAEAIKAQAQQAIQQLQDQLQQLHQAAQQAQQECEALKASRAVDAAKVNIEGYKAETERMQALGPVLTPEAVQQIIVQTVQTIMQQPVPQQAPNSGEPDPDDLAMMPSGPPPNPNPQAPSGAFFTPGANP